MAAFQTLSEGEGNAQGCPGWELPPAGWPQGSLMEGQYQDSERWHVLFREFQPSKGSDPLQSVHTMKALLNEWMRPDLHSKQQILDQLVLEKFMTCMPPELQVLVRERNVQSCEELEALLRNKEKPRKHKVLTIEGQEYLQEYSEEESLIMDLSLRSPSPISEVGAYPENSLEVLGEPGNQSGPSNMVWEQRQKVLLPEKIPKNSDPQGVRMEELEEDVMEDGEEAAVLTPPEALGASSPGDSLRTEGEQSPQEGISLEHLDAALQPPARVPETQASTQRGKGRGSRHPKGVPKRKRGNTPTVPEEPKEAGMPLDQGQVREQHGSNSVGASNTVEPVGREPGRQVPYQCEDCGKRFSCKSQLDLHRRSHTGERLFQCPSCPQRFIQASDLEAHLWTHEGQKPFRFYRLQGEAHPQVHAAWPPAGPPPGAPVPARRPPPAVQPLRELQRPHVPPLGPGAVPVSLGGRGLPPIRDVPAPPKGMPTGRSGGTRPGTGHLWCRNGL